MRIIMKEAYLHAHAKKKKNFLALLYHILVDLLVCDFFNIIIFLHVCTLFPNANIIHYYNAKAKPGTKPYYVLTGCGKEHRSFSFSLP